MKKYTAPELELYLFNHIDVLEGSGEEPWQDPDGGTPYTKPTPGPPIDFP